MPQNLAKDICFTDAVVAQANGLSHEQYAHVLSTFSHKSCTKAPDLCLSAFDELTKVGLVKFCKNHNPYQDIPLNMNLPKPVIELPVVDGTSAVDSEKQSETNEAQPVVKQKAKRNRVQRDKQQGNLL